MYCLIELNDFQEAKKLIKKQWKNKSSNLQYYVDLGFVNSRSDKPKKAKKLYEESIDKQIKERDDAEINKYKYSYEDKDKTSEPTKEETTDKTDIVLIGVIKELFGK